MDWLPHLLTFNEEKVQGTQTDLSERAVLQILETEEKRVLMGSHAGRVF